MTAPVGDPTKVCDDDFYSPDNLLVLLPFLDFVPQWLLLGGPADAREGRLAVELWPGINVIGVEPNKEAVDWQLAKPERWPLGHHLHHAALSDRPGTITVVAPPGWPRSTRVADPANEGQSNAVEVGAVTWDQLDERWGPFCDAILWMDVEGWELEALRGAERLLKRGAIRVVNLEQQVAFADKNSQIEAILARHGFRAVKDWNDSPSCRDRIWVKR